MRAFVFSGRRLRAFTVVVSAFAVWGSWLAVGGTDPAQAAVTTLHTFNVPGAYTWTVPTGVTKITFTVYGASGGNVANGSTLIAVGGGGGEAKGTFKVNPGETFEIVVGGRGGDNSGQNGGAGGFNGGGAGGTTTFSGDLGGRAGAAHPTCGSAATGTCVRAIAA